MMLSVHQLCCKAFQTDISILCQVPTFYQIFTPQWCVRVHSDNSPRSDAWGGAEVAEEEVPAGKHVWAEKEFIVVKQEVNVVTMDTQAINTP